MFLIRDERAEDLRVFFEMAYDLAVTWGAEELRVVRVVELLDPESLINVKMMEVKYVCALGRATGSCRDAARCILDQVEEHEPAALVLMSDDAGTGSPRRAYARPRTGSGPGANRGPAPRVRLM